MYVMCLSKGLGAIANWRDEQESDALTLGFVPNAGDTYSDPYFVEESRRRIESLGIAVKQIDLRDLLKSGDLNAALSGCHGLFVAGGNSFNLVHELRRSGTLEELREQILGGLAYFGESAGAAILSPSVEPYTLIDDPQDVPDLASPASLAILDFLVLPHIDREKYHKVFNQFVEKQAPHHRIVKIRDDQALLTRDGTTLEVLDSPIEEL